LLKKLSFSKDKTSLSKALVRFYLCYRNVQIESNLFFG